VADFDVNSAIYTLLALAISLFVLSWLSRQVSLAVQAVTYYMTGSADLASVIIFLLLLPGVLIHESAHWLAAHAVGLRTGKFRVWPTRQGDYIGLGSVSVERGDILRESIVGVAPLVVGNFFIALIGWRVFATPELLAALEAGRLLDTVGIFFPALGTADGLVWAYMLFTIGNSMMPSASDREPFKPVLLYTIFAALIYVVVGLPLAPVTYLLGWAVPMFEIAIGALIFLIVLDLLIWGLLLLVEMPLRLARRRR